MKNRPIHVRLGFALAGLRECWRTESSFRTHILLGLIGVAVLAYFRPAPLWWAIGGLAFMLVLALEMVNSALERLIDLLHPEIHPEIGFIKDMASGAVLLIGVGALIVTLAFGLSLL